MASQPQVGIGSTILKTVAEQWKAVFIGSYVLYHLLAYFVEADSSKPLTSVLAAYVSSALLSSTAAVWWVSRCKKSFLYYQAKEAGSRNVDSSIGVNVQAYFGICFVAAGAQLLPMAIYVPDAPPFWVASFVIISSLIATLWSYFEVGYPAGVNLGILDKKLRAQTSWAETREGLPESVLEALKAELAFLRMLLLAAVSSYGIAALTAILGFDELQTGFESYERGATLWFAGGISLLVMGLHLTVTGNVFGRYVSIMRWLRGNI